MSIMCLLIAFITYMKSECYGQNMRICLSCSKKGVFNVQEGHVLERRRAFSRHMLAPLFECRGAGQRRILTFPACILSILADGAPSSVPCCPVLRGIASQPLARPAGQKMPHPQSLPRTLDTINSRGVRYVYDDVRDAYGSVYGKYKVQYTAKLLKKKHHFVADTGIPFCSDLTP